MQSYRIVCAGAETTAEQIDSVEAGTDEEAIALVRAMKVVSECEIWQGGRFIATIPGVQSDTEAEAALEAEIRRGRTFRPHDAIARAAGPGSLKGASPVSPVRQAETEIANWLRSHVSGSSELQLVISQHLNGSELLLDNLDKPLVALASFCRRLRESDYRIAELVREADIEWGRRMDERPFFDRPGAVDHPSDPYTVNSVRQTLDEMLEQLSGTKG